MVMTRREFTITIDTETRNMKWDRAVFVRSAIRLFAGGWFVAFAGENRQAGVFGEFGLGERTLAKEEMRAFGGLDGASVEAIGAETDRFVNRTPLCWIGHGERIA